MGHPQLQAQLLWDKYNHIKITTSHLPDLNASSVFSENMGHPKPIIIVIDKKKVSQITENLRQVTA